LCDAIEPREIDNRFGEVGALEDSGLNLKTAREVQVTFNAFAIRRRQVSKIGRLRHVHREAFGAEMVAVSTYTAYQTAPNSDASCRLKRWEDIHALLDAGIDVLTTMNVQHLESLNDQIWHSTGVRVRATIPDWVLKQADEVVMVDFTRASAAALC